MIIKKIYLYNYKNICLAIVLIVQGVLTTFGQEDFNILPWKSSGSLNSWLLREVHQQYDQRDSILNIALSSEAEIENYRILCKRRFKEILGTLPDRSELNPKIVGTILLNNYRIERIIFESFPNHHVTSNLYIPIGNGPFPAVLFPCGHEATAKATESYQKTAQLFARNGFTVLVPDPISQGERYQIIDSVGKPATRGGTTEHTLLNAGSNLLGTSVTAYELLDNICALDYLETRTEVDKDRIGCIGNSGGGTQITYLIAFDERIKIAAPCSYIATRERNLELFGASDGCQHVPSEGFNLLEIEDFLISFAPKPLLILSGRFDFVDYFGVKQVEKDLKRIYSLYNKPNNIKLFVWDDGHGISKPKREAAVTFFKTFLCNDSTEVIEQESDILSESQLNCTNSGQVVTSFQNELTVQQYNLEKASAFSRERKNFTAQDEKVKKKKVEQLLGITYKDLNPSSEVIQKSDFETHILEKLIIRTDNEIPIPCLVYFPKRISSGSELVIILSEEGKNRIASSGDIIQSNTNEGKTVILADLRGVGETSDKPEQNDPKYWNKEYRNAMISLHIGKPIVGQRVNDLISIIQLFRNKPEYANSSITIIADGLYGPVALYTGIFEKSISSIHLLNTIDSYNQLIENPLIRDEYSYVIPSIMKYIDIPDIINWIGLDKVFF